MLDDLAVIALIRSGHIDAFAELVGRYQSAIERYLFRLTGNFDMTQDLAQESFIKAYEGIIKTSREIVFKPWLYRIATNTAYQRLRHQKILAFIPLDEDCETAGPSGDTDAGETKLAVEEALLKIPHDNRICLLLHFEQGLKYAEIGDVLGISEEAARKRVCRASRDFKKIFDSGRGATP